MGVIFMGSADFSIPILKALSEGEEVLAVVTQPDRPRGRGQRLGPTPVKQWANCNGIPVLEPQLLDGHFIEEVRGFGPEAIVVAAYGRMLPPELLRLPPLGCINVHPSLLPKYRGAAPVNWAIIRGESETGVTTFLMDEGMDSGPILLQRRVQIGEGETASELLGRLAELGAELLLETLKRWRRGEIEPRPQREEEATFAPKLRKEDGLIDWKREAREINNLIRGVQPWPGAYTFLKGKHLKVHRAKVGSGRGEPGEVISLKDGIEVACGKGSLLLEEVQLEGRRRVRWEEFLRGYPLSTGERLTEGGG
ncbi:MAG TPA: methionyl-tRNA formyltransferase [Anaerolineae bacterium]|nr:methionyl-tRNA formyltransferase [Anaerolineae bacterium]